MIFLVIYAIIATYLFIISANRHVKSVRSEAILFNALKYQNLKYNHLRDIFKRFEENNQVKPLKRDIVHFFNVIEKEYNKQLVEENKPWK